MATKDPDDSVVAIFKDFAVKNEAKSAQAGRPIFDDMEIVELRYPVLKTGVPIRHRRSRTGASIPKLATRSR